MRALPQSQGDGVRERRHGSESLHTKETTESKSTIVPGDAAKSKLYTTTVLPDDAKKLMPPRNKVTHDLERLTKEETETLKNWINEGAKWPAGVTLIARKKEAESAERGALRKRRSWPKSPNESPPQRRRSRGGEMKAYTHTIPGTDVTYDMAPIPGGKFKMGSPDNEPGHKPDEGPVHEVEISPFWMEKCEVTWNEFELFMYPNEEKKSRETKQLDPALNASRTRSRIPRSPMWK